MIAAVRKAGAAMRLTSDGDVTWRSLPSLPDSGSIFSSASAGRRRVCWRRPAVKALGGELLLRMWPRDADERARLLESDGRVRAARIRHVDDLVSGESALFCATGISDSALLPGVKLLGNQAITHSILMRARSRTVRYIRAVHDLEHKNIHLRDASPGST